MKNLLKGAVLTLLSIVPVLGAEVGIINDPFFTAGGAVRSISRVLESGPRLMAQVTATQVIVPDRSETRNILVEALCAPIGWANHDDELYSQERVRAQVICGPDLLEMEHTRALHAPYAEIRRTEGRFLRGTLMREGDPLPVGETVNVRQLIEYRRPDHTIYILTGTPLYDLLVEETRASAGSIRHCQREWEIFSQWQRKTRHQVQTYNNLNSI